MKHIPHTSRVFIGLLIISLLLTYIAITLSHYQERLFIDYTDLRNNVGSNSEPISTVDTEGWETYMDSAYPISFLHPENWTVKRDLTEDFYNITLAVPDSPTDIHIYISEDGQLGLDGLKQKPYKLGSLEGSIVDNNLISVKSGEYYYTFDASMNPEQIEEFHTLMQTVTFE